MHPKINGKHLATSFTDRLKSRPFNGAQITADLMAPNDPLQYVAYCNEWKCKCQLVVDSQLSLAYQIELSARKIHWRLFGDRFANLSNKNRSKLLFPRRFTSCAVFLSIFCCCCESTVCILLILRSFWAFVISQHEFTIYIHICHSTWLWFVLTVLKDLESNHYANFCSFLFLAIANIYIYN